MHTARTGGLGPTDESKIGEDRARELRDLAHLRPFDAGHGIEIDPQLVGMIEVLGAHRMRMQLEAREVGQPGERCGRARHHFVGGATRGEAQRHHLHPGRP